MATTWRAEPSRKSWPRVFSCQAMPWRSIRAMKAAGGKRLRADLAKCGLAERNRAAGVSRLGKLQRPPPEMAILAPGSSAWSSSRTRRPRWPAVSAAIIPAAPAPKMMASKVCIGRPRLALQQMAESAEGPQAVADDLHDGEHRHGQDRAGDAPHPVPEDQGEHHRHRVDGEAAGQQHWRDDLAFRHMDREIEARRQDRIPLETP